MKYPQGSFALFVWDRLAGQREEKRGSYLSKICRCALIFGLLAVAAGVPLAPSAFGQIQSTISCPSGHGYWDVLSVMMMDPGLASSYHMEGLIVVRLYPMGSKSGQGVLRKESAR